MVGAFVPWTTRSNSPGWIVQENGCHLWTGDHDKNGYGRVRICGRTLYIHRVRYEREVGEIPVGLVIDHFRCDTPSCCNPMHLRPVTPRENVLRGNAASTLSVGKTHCSRGHLLAGDNLSRYALENGERRCLACRKLRESDLTRSPMTVEDGRLAPGGALHHPACPCILCHRYYRTVP